MDLGERQRPVYECPERGYGYLMEVLDDVTRRSDPDNRIDDGEDNTAEYLQPTNSDSHSEKDYMELGERPQVQSVTYMYTQLSVQPHRPMYEKQREHLTLVDKRMTLICLGRIPILTVQMLLLYIMIIVFGTFIFKCVN